MPTLKSNKRSLGELEEILTDPTKHHLLTKEERASMKELEKTVQQIGKTAMELHKPVIEKTREWSKVATQTQKQTGAALKAMTAAFRPTKGAAQVVAQLMKSRIAVPHIDVPAWPFPEPIRPTPKMFEPAPQRVYVENQDQIADRAAAKVLAELKKEKELLPHTPKSSLPSNDSFNPKTGTGVIKGKKIRMLDGRKPLRTFASILFNNGHLSRDKVIEVMKLEPEKPGVPLAEPIHTSNTYKINALVKQIRQSTGLNTEELINSGGTLTLTHKISVTNNNLPAPTNTD